VAGTSSFNAEYVIVGSGAGGGTLAARLAEGGRRVLLLEAGGDPRELEGDGPIDPGQNRMPEDYDVPVFHPMATENSSMAWKFFVRHYADQAQQSRDSKFCKAEDGVFYPRTAALGGCTAHNALITVYPHNDDWDAIARATGDDSWRAERMRALFERMENCHHRPFWRWLSYFGINPTRHGWRGWLHTEKEIPEALIDDHKLIELIAESAVLAFARVGLDIPNIVRSLESKGDPNDWRSVSCSAEGIRYPPLATHKHARNGTRERLLEVARKFPDRLVIELDALATRVLFDGKRAIGVEYLKGRRLYRAHGDQMPTAGERRECFASREVVLCGGAFNTPQLLMLSGIGPADELSRHDIEMKVNLPGVGGNLQDRYEVGVINRMKFDEWPILHGAEFRRGDPQFQDWQKGHRGVYATNGAVLAVIKKSFEQRPLPDLFCFGLLGYFRGYFPGYSALFPTHRNYLTWAILKAHTNNRGGRVRLRSADPLDPPDINFHYFDEGTDTLGDDLSSLVAGVRFVRELTEPLIRQGLIAEEELPGPALQTDAELASFIRNEAWGHHASCSCPIGPPDANGVVDGDFRVHGVAGLRIVDASVFPRIPGFFVVTSVYMVAEKAADVMLAAAAGSARVKATKR